MVHTNVNDNNGGGGRPPVADPDAHGQVALLLAESILHSLVESKTLTNEQVVATVRSACDVKIEVATAAGEAKDVMHHSLALLGNIALSFGADTDR